MGLTGVYPEKVLRLVRLCSMHRWDGRNFRVALATLIEGLNDIFYLSCCQRSSEAPANSTKVGKKNKRTTSPYGEIAQNHNTMTAEEIQRGPLAWCRDQEKKLEKTPIGEIDNRTVELIQGVKYYALKRLREIAGKYDEPDIYRRGN